jgi:farnesyl diphosphate synthase
LGVAFQVIDDVLDVTADAATLGKTVGKDAANDKPTYVSLMGLEASRQYADDLLRQALTALERSGLPHTGLLADLALQVVARNH